MTRLKLSIAMCTYNGERFLREQLESLSHQTRLPDEVVVGDDGSSDATLEILETWARGVPFPVRITRNEKNLGFAKNFEATLSRCRGDILFPCDQDDVWEPEKIEKMAAVFEQEAAVEVVYCGYQRIDQDGNPRRSHEPLDWRVPPQANIYWPKLQQETPQGAGCLSAVRKTLLEKVFPLPPHWPHDMWIYVSAPVFGQMRTLDIPLIRYRRHEQNSSDFGVPVVWKAGKNTYYIHSVQLYETQTPMREELYRRWNTFPDNDYKRGYLEYLRQQDIHFGNRLKIEKNFLRNFPLVWIEWFSGRYFRYEQPWKSFCFDCKEGLLNLLQGGYQKDSSL
ncbi:MAG: glycosyltransferase family 2 protein [Planctomycetia bacterium]|nr:glycosyltransferase family 2 protein [Planctomycetia bacterium]